MADGLPMLAGMSVLGGVTTPHLSAKQTCAQMNPSVALLDALLAHAGSRLHRHQADEVLTRPVYVRKSPPSSEISRPKSFWRADATLTGHNNAPSGVFSRSDCVDGLSQGSGDEHLGQVALVLDGPVEILQHSHVF